ncbi:acyltransferase family protein [Ochrobactrum sp. A-1]|uniref:acyltransferase family protein n=1 Tax=Ochrobactrum sp. A-1 TaxID=2920940 RepID=UPI001F0A1108|nr:acyltransferase [Ochrobactrum sp. A-1]
MKSNAIIPDHIVWLDWVRFLAAFVVLASHARHFSFVSYGSLGSSDQHLLTAIWFASTRLANEAVIAFFVLSGFLVGGRVIEKVRRGSFHPGQYVLDRFIRIQVPLIPAVLFAAAVAAVQGEPARWVITLGNMLSLQGSIVPVHPKNEPLWSLAYEVWFYIVAGSLAALLTSRRYRLRSILMLAEAVAVFVRLDPFLFIPWGAGAIAYLYRPERFRFLQSGTAVALMLGATAYSHMSRASDFMGTTGDATSLRLGILGVSLGLALLLPQLRTVRLGAASRLAKLGTSLAAFSYSLYLVHVPVLYLMEPYLRPATNISLFTVAVYLLMMAVCMIVAWAFAAIFEANTARIKDAVTTHFGRQTASP